MTLPVAAWVTRDELGLDDLDIDDGDRYVMTNKVNPGSVSWSRQQVESNFVHGAFTIGRRKDLSTMEMVINVEADHFHNLTNYVEELVEAFEQDTFRLHIEVEGRTYEWMCETADHAVSWDPVRVHNRRVSVAFSIPRQPIPVRGV